MRIHDLPKDQRPRERLELHGPKALSDVELIALLLRSGTRNSNSVELAIALVHQLGDLEHLRIACLDDLARFPGLGLAKASSLVAAFELSRRSQSTEDQERIATSSDIARISIPHLSGLQREKVLVLVCDASNRLKKVVAVSEGSIDEALFPVREILNEVLRRDGCSFAIAHNHPSGDPIPSNEDTIATRKIRDAASVVGLRFLDHVVVADSRWCVVA